MSSLTATIPFSAAAIKAAATKDAPAGAMIRDAEIRGLILRKMRDGWHFATEKKVRGKVLRTIIGPLDRTALTDARQRAREIFADAGRADRVAEAAQAERDARAAELAAWSLLDALDHHAARIGMRPGSLATARGAARNFAALIPVAAIGDMKPHHIADAFATLRARLAPTTMRTQGKTLCAIVEAWRLAHPPEARPAFNIATEALRRSGRKTILPRAKVREERLAATEIGPWLAACRDLADKAGPILAAPYQALEALLLVGARADEMMRLRWDELAPGDDAMILPAERVKNGMDFRRPLPARVRAIIAERRLVREEGNPWVFPSWKARGKPIEDLRKACHKIADAGAPLMRPHDLRRSFAAAAARADVMGSPLKRLMGHALGDITEQYVGAMQDELPAAAQRVEDRMLAEAFPPQPEPEAGKVVRLARRARAA